ncbi:MFS transporter [Limnohabitans sp.]|uniref:MFS transporter n=1 Tax=Limnohabitans sp. TaxID=1907725 RepID=UPI0025BB00F8|nr:MFS transporter [Limnohabitans sp.]
MNNSAASRKLIYLLVTFGFVVMFLSTSIKSVYQIYFSDLAGHFGRGRADFAWSGSIFMLVTGLVSPLVGLLSDRFGPLRTVVVGAVAAGIALVGTSLLNQSLGLFILAYGFCGAFGLAAMTYVPMGVLVDRLFEQRKSGFAYAVITNGTSIGFIILSPFWLWLQPQVRWTEAFFWTGFVLLVPTAVIAWYAARRADSVGLGEEASVGTERKPSAWREVRTDPGFYALACGFFGCGATMAFVDVHLVAFWQDGGTSRTQMAVSLGMLGTLELVSGLVTGWLAMRYNKHSLLASFYVMRSLAMLLLLSSVSEVRTIVFASLFGASYLGTVVITSMYCLERYGLKIKGQTFGLLFLAHQLGAFVSVQLGAATFDAFKTYTPVIVSLAGVTIVGSVISWLTLRSSQRVPEPETCSLVEFDR